MAVTLARNEVFRASPFADNVIAEVQQSYSETFDPAIASEAKALKRYYDHRRPFAPNELLACGGAVLAYPATQLSAYLEQFPLAVQQFLEALHISQFYLIDFLNNSLHNFPFGDFKKQNKFKRIAGLVKAGALLARTDELPRLLPLFLFSRRFDIPVIYIISSDNTIPLALHLCDDGNLHLDYLEQHETQILKAAKEVGSVSGDLEICSTLSIYYLDKC